MKIIKTKFKDLVLMQSKNHKDNRGFFREIFIQKILKKNFVVNCMSQSKRNVIRMLHCQKKNTQ